MAASSLALARNRWAWLGGYRPAVHSTTRRGAWPADQPYPPRAVAWGATGVYRLHAGDIRVLYELDDQAATVYIINIGIIA